jgi:hypothetical protein
MENYTVLTYIIGDYETVHELEFDPATTPHVEYLLVTDNKNITSKTWKIVYDETLVNDDLHTFDRCYNIRFDLFKYATHDICVRIDGSIGINKPLDNIIQTFIDGNYDGCLNIHPGCDNIIEEYFRWVIKRGFSPLEAIFHVKYIQDKFNYNFQTKGLIELCFTINKRGSLTDNIDYDMKKMLRESNVSNYLYENKDKPMHYSRLDQILFTALVFSKYNNSNWMFVRDSLFAEDSYFTWYAHGDGNIRLYVNPQTFIDPYFNNKKVTPIENFVKFDNIDFFICSYKNYEPKVTNPVFKTLSVGNNSELNGENILRDDTGDNISHMNNFYSELTGYYWVWKNYQTKDWVGFCHYRRYFDFFDDIPDLDSMNCDIVVPQGISCYPNLWKHYTACHNIKDLELVCDIAKEKFSITNDVIEEALHKNKILYSFNMFIMKKELFNEYCEFIFGVLGEYLNRKNISSPDDVVKMVETDKNNYLKKWEPNSKVLYQSRIGGFLAERLFTIWIAWKSLKVKSHKVVLTEKNPTVYNEKYNF